jgi:hypothetical protein
MATGSIHHNSRTRRTKGEVEQWVKDHWPTGAPSSYLLGIPDTVVLLILIGVIHFSLDPFSQRAGEFMGGPNRRRRRDDTAGGVENRAPIAAIDRALADPGVFDTGWQSDGFTSRMQIYQFL